MSWNKIIECVPNFSEGRDLEKIDQIVAPFRIKAGVKLLDYSNDEDHNRLVVTLVGEPEALYEAIVEAVGVAVRLIDLNQHTGQHPRMGAVDVIPFIPIKNTSMEEAIELSKKVAAKVAEIYHLPVFLYEKSATASHRENLASVRKGEFEGMAEKIKLPEWQPDFGPAERHPTAGTVAIGARMPLVAYNINLSTDNLEHSYQDSKEYPPYQWRTPLCESNGSGAKGEKHHPGIHKHDRLYPYCPLPRLRTGTYRSSPLWCYDCR